MSRWGLSTLALAALLMLGGCSSSTEGSAVSTGASSAGLSTTPHDASADRFYRENEVTGAYWFATPDRQWRCAIVPQMFITRVSDPVAGCQPGAPTNKGFDDAPLVPDHFNGNPAQPDSLVVGKNEDAAFYSLGQPFFWAVGPNGKDLAQVLNVGETISAAGFTCNATSTGVSCKSDSTGKGFTISGRVGTLEYTPGGNGRVYRSTGPDVIPGSACKTVRIPATGAQVRVHVDAGVISCHDAEAVVIRYQSDRFLEHGGNSWSAEFDGWTCQMLTATDAENEGFVGECGRGDIRIRMRQP